MENQNDKKELLTAEEFAARRHMTPGSLANWRVRGKGPKFQPGRPVMYSMDEILKWESAQTVASTSQKK